jgi:hypothetical protein
VFCSRNPLIRVRSAPPHPLESLRLAVRLAVNEGGITGTAVRGNDDWTATTSEASLGKSYLCYN